MPLGTVVHDGLGQKWIYLGTIKTKKGKGESWQHRFIRPLEGKYPKAAYNYEAVQVNTIVAKFPDASEHILRPYMIVS
jgi:hypothetical protein